MATGQASPLPGSLRRAALVRDGAGLPDVCLLDQFVRRRDEAAFAALVRRHGPMVMGVCLRPLRHRQDAEDAFQATFLWLVRKAAAVESAERLANWLYGVAHHMALKVRTTNARRQARERHIEVAPEPVIAPREAWHDLRQSLDRELSRLPEKYRVPVVLCDLQNKTRREAADQLGWPEGTLSGRLSRARALLAKRLSRRGVALTGGALALAVSQAELSARVPEELSRSTVEYGTAMAAGRALGSIPPRLAVLLRGGMEPMCWSRSTVSLAVFGLCAAGLAALGILRATAGEPGRPVPARATAAPNSQKAVPPALKLGDRQFEIKMDVLAVNNVGREEILALPRVMAWPGQISTILAGQEIPAKARDGKGIEYLRSGVSGTISVHPAPNGMVRVDATFDRTDVEVKENEGDWTQRKVAIRFRKTVFLGERITVDLERNAQVGQVANPLRVRLTTTLREPVPVQPPRTADGQEKDRVRP
jgi:RNA polymerase sigma factor (sigma-70 family)